MTWHLANCYLFTPLQDLPGLKRTIAKRCCGMRGTILLAPEGTNVALAAEDKADVADALMDIGEMIGRPLPAPIWSSMGTPPFQRMKVRLKKETITYHLPLETHTERGTPVPPQDWNALIRDPEVLVLDTRNDFEVAMGSFQGAVDPKVSSFTALRNYTEQQLDPTRHKKIAMFCTGGIRCEKASADLKARGFENVYQLEGGILAYLQQITPEESLWEGQCFVFDERETVGHED